MGTVKVTMAVGSPQGRLFEDLEVTVDTGSTFTAVPRELLQARHPGPDPVPHVLRGPPAVPQAQRRQQKGRGQRDRGNLIVALSDVSLRDTLHSRYIECQP